VHGVKSTGARIRTLYFRLFHGTDSINLAGQLADPPFRAAGSRARPGGLQRRRRV
jgi:hypothetical protein